MTRRSLPALPRWGRVLGIVTLCASIGAAHAAAPSANAKATSSASKPKQVTPTSTANVAAPANPATPPWWSRPLADTLNARLDALGQITLGVLESRPLADRLNEGLDWLTGSLAQLDPRTAEPLGDRINRRIDRLYLALGEIDRRMLLDTARDLGLDGIVLRRPLTLPPANAEINPDQSLNLMQAWQAARVNDPTLRAARALLNASRERLPQARAQLLPQVQLAVSRFNNDLQREGQNLLGQSVNIFDRYPSSNETLSLRQPLFRMQQVLGVKQAQSGLQEAQAIFDREEQEFSLRVVQSYFEVLLAHDALDLIQTQQRFLETALQAAQRSLQAGVGTRTDVDAAQARLDLNRAQKLEAQQLVMSSRRQLQAFINRPYGDIARLDPQRMAQQSWTLDTLEQWVQRAEAGSPELRRLKAQRETLGLELNKARAGHLPTLDLVAQASRSRSENTLSPQSRFQNNQVGLQLNVPLYAGGAVNSATRQVSAEIERLDEQQEALRLDIGVRVHKEFRAITEGAARVRALEQAVRSADVALDSARKSVLAGVRTTVDVLNAEQQKMQAQRDLAQARYTMLAALARLHALSGDSDEALVARLSSVLSP